MPSIGDAGGLDKRCRGSQGCGDLVEAQRRAVNSASLLRGRTRWPRVSPVKTVTSHTSSRAPEGRRTSWGPAVSAQCDAGRLLQNRTLARWEMMAGRGGDGCGFDHAPDV